MTRFLMRYRHDLDRLSRNFSNHVDLKVLGIQINVRVGKNPM